MGITFAKPALTIAQQIELLRSRGLSIPNEDEAGHYLRFIGYYRLSGYWLPLTDYNRNGSHAFRKGATFTDVLKLYRFDRELRLLVMDAIERVEVAFRACVSDFMSEKSGPHWYLNKAEFYRPEAALEFGKKIMEETGYAEGGRGRGHAFLVHYFAKYSHPPLPPSWMVCEVLSLSTWSKAFENLALREDRKRIASHFGLDPKVLESWMHAVSYVRNLCAHHARLWNREFTIRPMIANEFKAELKDNSRFFAQVFVLRVLLEKACPQTKWWERLGEHLGKCEFVDKRAMGF